MASGTGAHKEAAGLAGSTQRCCRMTEGRTEGKQVQDREAAVATKVHIRAARVGGTKKEGEVHREVLQGQTGTQMGLLGQGGT